VSSDEKNVKANNKYMGEYNEDVVSSYISYLDANNLYGLAMSKKLPYKDFQFTDSNPTVEEVMNYKNDDIGYFLEVDLTCPKHLHDKFSDYPLAPVNECVTADMVSKHSKNIYTKYHGGGVVKDEKIRN
jgi:hypothetical protein